MKFARKYIALFMTLSLTGFTACGGSGSTNGSGATPQQSEVLAPTSSAPAPSVAPSSREDDSLSDYLAPLLEWENDQDMAVTFIRDDMGIQIPAFPMYYEPLAECLMTMDLVPYGEGQTVLDIPYPFSLAFRSDEKERIISFTKEKITVGGTDYSPSKPEVINAYLDDEHTRFLTGNIYLLQTEIPFTEDDITGVHLEEHENYSDGVTEVNTSDPAEISKIVRTLGQTVARRFEANEEPGAFVGVGGNSFYCTLTLRDGSEWSINPQGGFTTITSSAGTEDIFILHMDHGAVFGLLAKSEAVPQLTARIGEVTPTVYEKAYQFGASQKSQTHIVPVAMYFDSDPVLAPGDSHACRLEWPNGKGGQFTPVSVTATLYRETDDPLKPVDAGTPLQINGNKITLPGGAGKQFVTVRAGFQDTWVEHIFSYRSSIFPTAFYDIEYGNSDGGVTLTRTDSGVSVVGTQNRKYVDFVMGLELSDSDGAPQSLPVREPFAMEFLCDGEKYGFAFSAEGVTFNGQPYNVGNPQAIEDLYAPFDIDDPNIFERVDYSLRGFLTKDVAYFTDKFPFAVADVEKFRIIREEPDLRTVYDMSGVGPDRIMEILGYVVLGSDWRESDYYNLRRFYFSYEVALKDGTVYTIGERILKNGQDIGWYTIQSDSPLAARQIEGLDGTEQLRDRPVHGGIAVDEAGNVIIE